MMLFPKLINLTLTNLQKVNNVILFLYYVNNIVETIDICFKDICIYHERLQIVSVNECLINIKDIISYDVSIN